MKVKRWLAGALALLLVAAGCGDDDDGGDGDGVTLRLVTHDSFAVSDEVLEAFTAESGIAVEIVASGDAGAALNLSILNRENPLGDVFFGVDNTFLTRALDADLFLRHRSPAIDDVDPRFVLDDEHRVTPIDHGEVCVNFDRSTYPDGPPATFEDLAGPTERGRLVVQNPATSSPGLAFLLGTIAHFGEDDWQDWWRALVANDVLVATGWEEAYYQHFSGGSGEGDRPLVVSYATSPPAEVIFAEPQPDDAPTGVLVDTCVEQIEFAGILQGTEHEDEARQLIDFMLSPVFQADMPMQMFVLPVVEGIDLPEEFVAHAAVVPEPLRLDPADIDVNRDRWIDEWTEIVLG